MTVLASVMVPSAIRPSTSPLGIRYTVRYTSSTLAASGAVAFRSVAR